jgi:hypothetical protein
MGLWYGAEIITHHENEVYETTYDTCVVVHLADVNEVSMNPENRTLEHGKGSTTTPINNPSITSHRNRFILAKQLKVCLKLSRVAGPELDDPFAAAAGINFIQLET